MVRKFGLAIIYCLVSVVILVACNSKKENQHQYKDPELVEVKDSDRSVQFYLPMNVQAWVNGNSQTTNDLKPSGRLLLTSDGNVKAMEFSNGYQKVYSFRCEPIGNGWYKITCWLRNWVSGEKYSSQCYTREKI